MSVTRDQLFNTILRNTLENDNPTFHCTSLTSIEVEAITKKNLPIDVDYLAIQDRCDALFKKPDLVKLFGDSSCVFFKTPKREKIYSAVLREVLTIGKIGDYKLSIKSVVRPLDTDVQDNNLNDEVADKETQHSSESAQLFDDEYSSNGEDEIEFDVTSRNDRSGDESSSSSDSDSDDENESLIGRQNSISELPASSTPTRNAPSSSTSSICALSGNGNSDSVEDDRTVDQNTTNSTTDLFHGIVMNILRTIRSRHANPFSFTLFTEFILKHFTDSHLVIWKHGQKVPLGVMLPRLMILMADAKLPVEIALGIQFNIPNQYVCAEVKQGLYSCSYSNFLSNRMCNICITDPKVARKYRQECYRVCVYNVFHHVKKTLNYVLLRDKSQKETTLEAFKKSFMELIKTYREVIDQLKENELRLETYVVARNLKQLKKYADTMKELLKSFNYVVTPLGVLERRLHQYGNVLEDLFEYSLNCSGIEAFLFFLFYDKFKYFMNSTKRINRRFLDSNLGMVVDSQYFDRKTGRPTLFLFNEKSLNEIHSILLQTFFDKHSRKPHLMYFYISYYVEFKSQVDAESALRTVAVGHIADLIFTKLSRNCKSLRAGIVKEFISVDEMYDIFIKKYTNNTFFRKCIEILKQFSSMDVFNTNLQQFLAYIEFNFLYHKTHYIIGLTEADDAKALLWGPIEEFMESTTYEEFLMLKYSKQQISNKQYLILNLGDRIFNAYKKNHVHWISHFYPVGTQVPLPKFHVIIEEVMSFVLMTFPKIFNDLNSGLVTCSFFFNNFKALSKFIFAALVKYHAGHAKPSMRLVKYIENTVHFKYWSKDKHTEYTFNRLILFSGRFDVVGRPSGISLPLPKKVLLTNRWGSHPHPHLTQEYIDYVVSSAAARRIREPGNGEVLDQMYSVEKVNAPTDSQNETANDLVRAEKHSISQSDDNSRRKIYRTNDNDESNFSFIQQQQSAIPEDNAETATSDQHESRTGNGNSLGGGFDEFQQGDASSNSFPVNDSLNCSSFSGLSDAFFSGSSDTFSNAASDTYSSASSSESSNASSNGSSNASPHNESFHNSQASDSVEYSSESFNSSNNSMNCSQTSDSFDYSSSSSNGSYSPSSSNETFKYAPLNDSFYSPMNDSISSSSGDETSDAYLPSETYYTPLIVKSRRNAIPIVKSKSPRPIVKSRNVTSIIKSKKRFTSVQSGSVTPIVKSSKRSAVVQSRRCFTPVIESRKNATLATQSKNFASIAQPRMNFTAVDDFENFPSPFAQPRRNDVSVVQFKRSFIPVSQSKNDTSVVPSKNSINPVSQSRNITPTVQSEWNIMPIRQFKRSTNQSKWNTVPKEINSNSTSSNEEGLLFNPTIIFGIVFVVIVFQLISFFFRWISIVFFNNY